MLNKINLDRDGQEIEMPVCSLVFLILVLFNNLLKWGLCAYYKVRNPRESGLGPGRPFF